MDTFLLFLSAAVALVGFYINWQNGQLEQEIKIKEAQIHFLKTQLSECRKQVKQILEDGE